VTFRASLARHLEAIRNRDLEALADTVAEETLVLATEYREPPSVRSESSLTLVFQRREAHDGKPGRWLMVQDQNTPIRQP
jgi:hypothetical protein